MRKTIRNFHSLAYGFKSAISEHRKEVISVMSTASTVAGLFNQLATAAHAHLAYAIVVVSLILYTALRIGFHTARNRKGEIFYPRDLPVRKHMAFPYSDSSKHHIEELSGWANEVFDGDTLSPDAVWRAVQNNSLFGLRLMDEKGKENIGFIDVIHFKEDTLEKWIEGDSAESSINPDHFAPINFNPPAGATLKLAIGALCVIRPGIASDFCLTGAFVEAGIRYLQRLCDHYDTIILYATIFNEFGGKRWAENMGFKPCFEKEKRKGAGQKHDVYRRVLKKSDFRAFGYALTLDGKTFTVSGRKYKYEIAVQDDPEFMTRGQTRLSVAA